MSDNKKSYSDPTLNEASSERPKLVLGLGGNPLCPTVTVVQLCTGEEPEAARRSLGLIAPHIGS